GRDLEGHVLHGADTAEGDRELAQPEASGACTAAEPVEGGIAVAGRRGTSAQDAALVERGETCRAQPQDREEQRAEDEQAVFDQRREHLRQQSDDRGAERGSGDRANAAQYGEKQKEDRLQEGKVLGRDEARERREE